MKKTAALLLTLTLLLTACAAPAPTPEPTPAPTPAPTPTPAQTPTPAPTPEPDPEPKSLAGALIPQDVGAPLPEQEFEVDSVWGTPEPDGRVMLLLSAPDGGEVSAALYDAGMLTDGPETARTVAEILAEPQPRTVKFTARSVGDGKFYDSANAVSLAVDGDTLSFSDSELSIDLIRLTDSEAPLAWARMPVFAE